MSEQRKTVIIGGVAGGASCAARLRRLDADREIVILERGAYISYANCGLPYHVGDVIKNRSALLLMTPERMWERFRIDVRVQNEVTKIDRVKKTVTVRKTDVRASPASIPRGSKHCGPCPTRTRSAPWCRAVR